MVAPVVNTNTTGAKRLLNIDTAESTATWAGFNEGGGGNPSPVLDNDIFIQGNAAISAKISGNNQNKGIWTDFGGSFDMTAAGLTHLFIWVAVTTQSLMNTIANGGLYIKVGSGVTGADWNKYFVGGSDFFPPTSGGSPFVRFVIDIGGKTPSETAATALDRTACRWFGAGLKSTGTSKSENLIIDRIDYGAGVQIEAGDTTTPATWAEFFAIDSANANKYGIIDERSGVFFLKGGLTIGDPAGTVTTLWDDINGQQVVFENPVYHNGTALVSSIDEANLYNIDLAGNGTGTTDITWGAVVGSGDDRQGLLGGGISSDGPKWTLDGETDIADLDSVNLYGMSLQGAGNIQLSGSTKTDVIGCTFLECDEVQPNDAEFLNNTFVGPVPDLGLEMVSGHNIKQLTFVAGSAADQPIVRAWVVDISATPDLFLDQTSVWNSVTANSALFMPATEAIGDYCAFGSKSKFAKLRINTGTAGVGGTVKFRYWNGSAWTDLAGVTDGTTNLTTTGLQNVTYTIPTDWAAVSLNDESPLFYISVEVLTTYSTNPIGTQAFIADTIEHHLHWPAAGTFSIDALEFFGFAPDGAPKWHALNDSGGLVTANAINGANLVDAEVEDVGGGSTTTVNNPQTITITCVDSLTALPIENVRIFLEETPGGTDIFLAERTNASGIVTTTFNGALPQNVTGFARKGTEVTVYKAVPINGTIVSGAGFTQTVVMTPDN